MKIKNKISDEAGGRISTIKNTIRSFLFYDVFRLIILPIIYVHILASLAIFIVSLFVDYEELYSKFALSEIVEYQLVVLFFVFLFEVVFILFLAIRYAKNNKSSTSHIQKLISAGENDKTEFKSSLRWDYKEGRVNKELEYVIAKTISAFLNTTGGTLLIGVSDDKQILGIERDYATLKKRTADGFLLHITQIINSYLGKEFHQFLYISIESIKERKICFVKVLPAKTPVFINHNGHQKFFIRASSSVQPMDIRDANAYIKNHWKK